MLKSIIKKYLVAVAIGAAMSVSVIMSNDFSSQTLVDKYRILADAFTIPGVILILVGALVFVSTSGFFDMLSYGLRKFAGVMSFNLIKTDESFYDYKMRKNGERFSGYSFLFFTGIAFLIIAVVCMMLFYRVYE